VLGFSAWYLLGKNPAVAANKSPKVLSDAAQVAPAAENNHTPEKTSEPGAGSPATPPPNTVAVAAAVIETGGNDEKNPARKVSVDSFYVSETEVTNEQYQAFVKETNYAAPHAWKNGEFPAGAANEPVTGVGWQAAVDYCQWLSKKTGSIVRLPSEAEWELAARGPENFKYPWGNDWDDRAAASENKSGFIHAVRSYPQGRASCGAYDMAGNAWEWVADELDADGKIVSDGNSHFRVIKGGAANEHRSLITATSRNVIPKDYSGSFVGFRYVVAKH
jgi:formylglycine-generating enzyme required for sulfatase activity